MHPQLKAVRGLVQADGVVDVLGLGAVDGEDGQGAQVHPALGVGVGDSGPFQFFGFLPHRLGEADVDVPGIQQGLGAALGLLAGAEPHDHRHPVVLLAHPAGADLHGDLIAVLGAALAVPQDLHRDGGTVVRHEHQLAADAAGGAHQIVLLFQHGQDLALVAALHAGMGQLFHQDAVAGHGALHQPAGDEDIARTVLQHGKPKVFAQLDQGAGQGLVLAARPHREKDALGLADHSLPDQLVQRFHHFAVGGAVPAEFGLQVPDGAGLHLDGPLDLISHWHTGKFSFTSFGAPPAASGGRDFTAGRFSLRPGHKNSPALLRGLFGVQAACTLQGDTALAWHFLAVTAQSSCA